MRSFNLIAGIAIVVGFWGLLATYAFDVHSRPYAMFFYLALFAGCGMVTVRAVIDRAIEWRRHHHI